MVGPGEILVFSGTTKWTHLPGQPVGTVGNVTTLTAVAGTGRFAAVTGTVVANGSGVDVFGPGAGPGISHLDYAYSGNLCF